jgi:6-phosphofructokinase 2
MRLPAPKVEACSSVDAGDSFVAGLVLRLAQGAGSETAFRFALAISALRHFYGNGIECTSDIK